MNCRKKNQKKKFKSCEGKKEEWWIRAVCESKKSKFNKEQEASTLLSSFGKTPLSKIPLVGPPLF